MDFIGEELKNDKDFILTAIEIYCKQVPYNPHKIKYLQEYAGKELQTDPEFLEILDQIVKKVYKHQLSLSKKT